MGEAIPNFSLEYEKGKNIKYIPQIYLMAYDFFCFLNFRRNIIFNKITLQIKKMIYFILLQLCMLILI